MSAKQSDKPDTLPAGMLFLCRASGEGTQDFRVCKDQEAVFAFYEEMCGKDQDGTIDSIKDTFADSDHWSGDGYNSFSLDLYMAQFEVWKVDAKEVSAPLPESQQRKFSPKFECEATSGCQLTNNQCVEVGYCIYKAGHPAPAAPAEGQTPRTDSELRICPSMDYDADGAFVDASFARQLERELAEEKAAHLKTFHAALHHQTKAETLSAIGPSQEEIEYLGKFINCSVFSPPPEEIARAHRIYRDLVAARSTSGRSELEAVGLFRKIDGKWVQAEDRTLCEGDEEETAQFLYRSTEGDK